MTLPPPLGRVAQATLDELAHGQARTASELYAALQAQRIDATLATVYRTLDHLRDHQFVALAPLKPGEADLALADAGRIARQLRGTQEEAPIFDPRFVVTLLGSQRCSVSQPGKGEASAVNYEIWPDDEPRGKERL